MAVFVGIVVGMLQGAPRMKAYSIEPLDETQPMDEGSMWEVVVARARLDGFGNGFLLFNKSEYLADHAAIAHVLEEGEPTAMVGAGDKRGLSMKKGYRQLVVGEVIKATDEILHRNHWRLATEFDCVGTQYCSGMKPIRRKI